MREYREDVIETLHDVATNIQSEETITGVCERTVSAAAGILDFNLCTVILREDDWLVPYATSEDAPADGSRRMRVDEGLAGETYRTGTSRVVSEVTPSDETEPAKETYRSGISVPIGEHGVFQAVDTTTDAFDDSDIELAELLVSHTATALDRLVRERELERQNERLDRFASAVSHDLRNPLNVASGRLELLAEECESPHLDAVADAHDRMEHLIEDLLTFARMGTDSIEYTAVDLGALVDDRWDELATAGATLHTESARAVRADRDRLQQLVDNLLKNALDHGGADVTVTVGELDDGFYVEDDGPGVPEGDRAEVFEAGFTSSTDGTGFGLNIVEQVADVHGWEVTLTTGSDGGARFEIHDVDLPVSARES
jgi:signal transduction histidine kinase